MATIDEVLERAHATRLPTPEGRRALRIAARLTQSDVGEAIGVDRASVARYEAGRRSPRGDVRRRYAELLERLAGEW
jgi:transcriptional regulator with XRE-family HTH domain